MHRNIPVKWPLRPNLTPLVTITYLDLANMNSGHWTCLPQVAHTRPLNPSTKINIESPQHYTPPKNFGNLLPQVNFQMPLQWIQIPYPLLDLGLKMNKMIWKQRILQGQIQGTLTKSYDNWRLDGCHLDKSPQSVQIQCSLELITHWVVNRKVGRGGFTRILRNKWSCLVNYNSLILQPLDEWVCPSPN